MSEEDRRGITLSCPYCGKRAGIRTSRQVTEIYRECWAMCDNCAFVGKAHVAWDAEVNPSMLPNPTVDLPRVPTSEGVAAFVDEEIARQDQKDLFANSG